MGGQPGRERLAHSSGARPRPLRDRPAPLGTTFTARHTFGLVPVRGGFPVRGARVGSAEPLAGSRVRAEPDRRGFPPEVSARDTAPSSPRFPGTARHPSMTYTAHRLEARP
ncbi:hypothetical protein [Streptomyces sp. NPDC052811]|uniref:hypothetical protein n=1 Tax=Streptomyces sp. NPDC052811 TaxID=3155731 RepID=UPI003431F470